VRNTDGIDRNLITLFIGAVLVLSVLGGIMLALTIEKVPDQLWNLAFAGLGALGGALLPRQSTPEDNPPPLEQPEPAEDP
jgi:hypothetical protein